MEFLTVEKPNLRIWRSLDSNYHSFRVKAKCVGPKVVYVNESHTLASEYSHPGADRHLTSEALIVFSNVLEDIPPARDFLNENKRPLGKGSVSYGYTEKKMDISFVLPLTEEVFWEVYRAGQESALQVDVRFMLPYGDNPDGMDQVLFEPHDPSSDFFYSDLFVEYYLLETVSPVGSAN